MDGLVFNGLSVLVLTCEVYESVVVEPHEIAPRHVREVTQIGSVSQ